MSFMNSTINITGCLDDKNPLQCKEKPMRTKKAKKASVKRFFDSMKMT